MRKKILEGKTFGHLYVKSVSEVSRNGHYRYHVICDCGTEKTVLGTHLISNKTTSCGCRKCDRRHWKGVGTISSAYFSSLKRGANGSKGRSSIPFDITIEFIADLLDNKQGGLCALSGLFISIYDKTASLDRIDSSGGYTKDNVQWLHKDINMMKRHYSEEYFKYLCSRVADSCEIVDLV